MSQNLSPEIKKIRSKIITERWPRYIDKISIFGLHGLNNKTINFDFPICAIVGENGTGKSTLLKIIACAYKSPDKSDSLFPSEFFPDTAWDRLTKIKLTYQIRQGDATLIHNIKKPSQRWKGITERKENRVYYFDLNRIQPIESIIGYSKLAKRTNIETASRDLHESSVGKISEIMGRDYVSSRYAKTQEGLDKEVGILGFDFGELSQFHQGAGEAITSNFISTIENIPDNALVVIDEVESSLHPKAQRRLIRELLHLTRVKRLQVVMSTHSPYILSELPPEARILLARTKDDVEIVYAPTLEFCLSEIDDKLHSELDVVVEDKESEILVGEIIRNYAPELCPRIRIIPVGAANVVETLHRLDLEKKFPYKLLGIVDSDQAGISAVILPGQFSPEKQIITDISKTATEKLAQTLMLDTAVVEKELSDVQLIIDYHEWLDRLSKKLNVPQGMLWVNLVYVWVKNCLNDEDALKITNIIKNRLESDN